MILYLLPCLYLLIPLVFCAIAIHWFERLIQGRLSSRFGWNSVLWTGWLGTPIHETSHALMCLVFRHRIDEIAFFQPDRKSGRLGYVRHSFHQGNWFEEMGNLFIGIAPLLGGSVVLLILLQIFYPDAATAAWESVPDLAHQHMVDGSSDEVSKNTLLDSPAEILRPLWDQTRAMFLQLLSVADWAKPRWWIFLYLVLCVGSHMAPSRSDYQGSLKGGLIATALFVAGMALVYLFQLDEKSFAGVIATIGAPLVSLLALATGLCGLSTLVVVFATSLLPTRGSSSRDQRLS